jgi:hypothetical protein
VYKHVVDVQIHRIGFKRPTNWLAKAKSIVERDMVGASHKRAFNRSRINKDSIVSFYPLPAHLRAHMCSSEKAHAYLPSFPARSDMASLFLLKYFTQSSNVRIQSLNIHMPSSFLLKYSMKELQYNLNT